MGMLGGQSGSECEKREVDVEYYSILNDLCYAERCKRKVIKIRQAATEEEAISIYHSENIPYYSYDSYYRYDVATRSGNGGSIRAIESLEKLLDSFGIKYPTREQIKEAIINKER